MAKSIDTFFTKKSAVGCICPAHKNFLYEFTYNDIITNRPKGTEEVDVVILLEHREYASVTRLFSNLVKYLVPKDKTYAIINALGCTPKGFKSSDTIQTYVKCKKYHIKAQLDKLKPKVIITTGRAIYHISESKEMLFHHFYSLHEDDTWFYAPEYGCKVYPIPALYTFINTRKEEEMCSLLDVFELDFTKKQFGRAIKSLSDPVKRRPELKYVHLEDPNKFLQELYDNKEREFIAVDSETTGKNYWKDKIINLTIAYDKITGYFLPFEKIDIELLNKVLLSKKLIFQNGKFDMKFLIANGIKDIKCYFDTMIAGYAINENSKNSLKFFVWVYTLYGGYENELRTYLRELGSHDFSAIPLPILLKYACTDAIMTYAIFRYFENRLKEEPEVEYNFYNYMMPAVNMLTEVEMHGIKIDQKYLYEYNEYLFNKLKEIDKQLEDYFGESFNYNSKKKLSEKLREKGIEPLIDDKGNVKIAKNGDLILDKDALAEYAKKGNVACGMLVERNHISKEISGLSLKKYYQENVLDNEIEQIKQKSMNDLFALCKTVEIEEEEEEIEEDADPLTKFDIDEISETVSKGLLSSVYKGALYGEFNVSGTTTGRLSSSGGLVGTINFQNFPKTYEFRRIFAPRDGYIYSERDYCVVEGTKVYTDSGIKNIESIIPFKDKVLSEDGNFHNVINFFSRGVKDIVEITTKYGFSLKCSKDHKLKIVDINGDIIWKEAKHITSDDHVSIFAQNTELNTEIKLPNIVYSHRHGEKIIPKVPESVSPELCEFIGYMTGDGHKIKKNDRWFVGCGSLKDLDTAERIKFLINQLFGIDVEIKLFPEKGIFGFKVYSKPLTKWLYTIGVSKQKIPDFLFRANDACIKAWLIGYFEADGHKNSCSSKNEQLIKDIQLLFLRIGIVSIYGTKITSIKDRKYTNYGLAIPPQYLDLFLEKIQYISNRKKFTYPKRETSRRPTMFSFPNIRKKAKEMCLRSANFPKDKRNWQRFHQLYSREATRGGRITVDYAKYLSENYKDIFTKFSIPQQFITKEMIFVKVHSVNKIEETLPTYDIEVENTHSYIANGFVNHNCAMEVSQLSQHAGPGPLEKVVLDNLDPHCYTGVDIYKAVTGRTVSYEEFLHKAKVEEDKTFKEYRGIAKACNFSFSYGATEFGIAGTLGISVEQGKLLLDTYMRTYPEVSEYMKRYREHACEYGYVSSLLGKRRRLPQLTYRGRDTKLNAISNLLNGAINAPIQSTSGQTTYIAMTRIHNEFKEKNMKSRILANVHDSILFELHESEIDEANKIIEYWMEYPYYENYNGNKVRLKTDPKTSHVWGFSDKEEIT